MNSLPAVPRDGFGRLRATGLDGLGLAFVLLWSSGYVVGALATEVIAPLTVTMWRFAGAAAVLAVIARYRKETWPRGRQFWALAGMGVPMFALQFGALYTAMSEGMPASTTSLVACSSPLLVAVLSAAAGWERLRARQWVGILLGVAGVAVTLADRVGRPPSLGVLGWTLLGLLGLVIGTLLQSRVRIEAGPSAVVSVELAAAFVVMAVWAPLKGNLTIPLTAHALGTFAWLTLIAGVGAPLLLFALIRQRGATGASSLLFVVPAVTAIAAWPILGTPIGPLTLVGLVVVGFALRLARPVADAVATGEAHADVNVDATAARETPLVVAWDECADGRPDQPAVVT